MDRRRMSAARCSGVGAGAQARRNALADLRLATTLRQRGELASCDASQPPFAPLVVEGPLEERHVPAVRLKIAIGVVVWTDAAIDGQQLPPLMRAVRASR